MLEFYFMHFFLGEKTTCIIVCVSYYGHSRFEGSLHNLINILF